MVDLASVKPPLTNVQFEILKTFAVDLPDDELEELKKIISHFLWERVRNNIDKVCIEKGYDQSTIEKWLNED